MNDLITKWQTGEIQDRDRLETEFVERVLGHSPITDEEEEKAERLKKKLGIGILKGSSDPKINALISAETNDEKVALLQAYRGRMGDAQFQELKDFVLEEKIVSDTVIEQLEGGSSFSFQVLSQIPPSQYPSEREAQNNYSRYLNSLPKVPEETVAPLFWSQAPPKTFFGELKEFWAKTKDKFNQILQQETRLSESLREGTLAVYPFTDRFSNQMRGPRVTITTSKEYKTRMGAIALEADKNSTSTPGDLDADGFTEFNKIRMTEMTTPVVAHEMLHAFIGTVGLPNMSAEEFNQNWAEIEKGGPDGELLKTIDGILANSYLYKDINTQWGLMNERYAYLGAAKGILGLDGIPDSLKPAYMGIFEESRPRYNLPPGTSREFEPFETIGRRSK